MEAKHSKHNSKQMRQSKEELSFIDTFPSNNRSQSSLIKGRDGFKFLIINCIIDDRPIKPQRNPLYGGVVDLEVIPEKTKTNKATNQKTFLKKQKVYDPLESIKKEKEHKRKAREENKRAAASNRNNAYSGRTITKVNKSPTKIVPVPSQASKSKSSR